MSLYKRMTPGCRMFLWTNGAPHLEFDTVEWNIAKDGPKTFKAKLREAGFLPETFNITLYAANKLARCSEMTLEGCTVTEQDGLVIEGTVDTVKTWKEDAAKPDQIIGAALNFENLYDSNRVIGNKTAVEGSVQNLVKQLALYGDGRGYWNPMPAKIKVKLEIFYPEGSDTTKEADDGQSGTGHDETATQGSD